VTQVAVHAGDSPVILGVPHAGTDIPEDLLARLNDRGRDRADTDWWVDRLYQDLLPGATLVKALFHRYVIDANRDPEGASLYPGQNTTALCPTTDFDGAPIWQPGEAPGPDEIEARRVAYHAPYRGALATEIERIKARHGVAVLYDCHSIRSHIPYLFEGELSALNIGDNQGATCAPLVRQAAVEAAQASGFTSVLNGRFKGGWTTRHYGRPSEGVHAVQMEIAQSAYMDEAPPWTYRDDLAERLRPHLKTLLERLERLALDGALA